MNHLNVKICKDVDDAVSQGFIYPQGNGWTAVEIEKVVVVKNGTMEGNSTVDLLLKDDKGNKFVVMLTGKLVKSIPC